MRRPWDAIVWWELRRILFNLIILVVGCLSIGILIFIGSHYAQPGQDVLEPMAMLVGAVMYAIAANLFYSMGWISEVLWSNGDTSRTESIRQKVFVIGVIFSIGLTLLPGIIPPLIWVIWGYR
ncbi:MAG: hypothetical protein ABI443_01410 [Chthoniobacterales bacterium]